MQTLGYDRNFNPDNPEPVLYSSYPLLTSTGLSSTQHGTLAAFVCVSKRVRHLGFAAQFENDNNGLTPHVLLSNVEGTVLASNHDHVSPGATFDEQACIQAGCLLFHHAAVGGKIDLRVIVPRDKALAAAYRVTGLARKVKEQSAKTQDLAAHLRESFSTSMQRIAIVILASMLLAIVLAGLLSKRLSLPIVRLSRAAENIACGNFYASPVLNEGPLELRNLSHDLDAMRISLRDHIETLDQTVAERTRDLARINHELEQASKLKDEFLAGMSHELRTPLNAVLGMSEALHDGVYGSVTAIQRKPIEQIEASGRHLLSLINDILDLSKIEAGEFDFELRSVSLKSVCQASLQFVTPMALKKDLAVEVLLDEQVSYIQADARRMKQILANLLSNAVKFTPYGGTIGIEAKGKPKDKCVDITVWDKGIGIAQEDLPRLFRPFEQLDSRLSRSFEGTGLGLSLVKKMTEMHQGVVSVQSAPGKGSRFTISLPWDPLRNSMNSHQAAQLEAEGKRPETVLTPPQDRKPVILLVEDNEINVSMVYDFLDSQGYTVLVARNGEQAVEYTARMKPGMILMDLQMPVMDGFEATRRIRETHPDVPIIALTALAMPGDRDRSLAAGMNEYLSKPFSLSDLQELIVEFTQTETKAG